MSNFSLSELRAQRERLFPQLKEAYTDSKPEYLELKLRLTQLTNEINSAEMGDEKTKKKIYDPNLAIFVDGATDPNVIKNNQARIDRLNGYKDKPAVTPEEKAQEIADNKWRSEQLLRPISGNKSQEWYSNVQAGALTGGEVTVGADKLGDFLNNNQGKLPLSFAHIVTGPNDQNHFVSYDIRTGKDGKPQITYVDSNGDLMPDKERAVIARQFPGIEVKYLSKEGQKISESAAKNNQANILRVQFDDHNCGMYTSETINMFKATNGNPEEIAKGVARLKEISNNPDAMREKHARTLESIARNPDMEKSIHSELLQETRASILGTVVNVVKAVANLVGQILGLDGRDRQASPSAAVDYGRNAPSNEQPVKTASLNEKKSPNQDDSLALAARGARGNSDPNGIRAR